MSSWLSGGITSLTDQISSFTKEVIAESTQEIEDPVTELQLARKRIEEVEKQNAQNNEELKRCRERTKELEDRAETAELQVVNNNHQYKKLIQEKDEELKQLRSKCLEMQEQQKKLVFSSDPALPVTGPSNNLFSEEILTSGSAEFGLFEETSDCMDYADMEGFQSHSHSQVNQLQSEVARLQVECQHWKDLARCKNQTFSGDEESPNSQIQELQQKLEEERHRHEHELTTLQVLHSKQLEAAALLSHKQIKNTSPDSSDVVEVSEAARDEQLLAQLQKSQSLTNELNTFVRDIKQQLKSYQGNQAAQFETERTTLMSYLDEMQDSLLSHQKKVADLESQQTTLTTETTQLNTQVEVLQEELKNKEAEIYQLKCTEDKEVGVATSVGTTATDQQNDIESVTREMESERVKLETMLLEEQQKKDEIRKTLEKVNADHERQKEDARLQKEQLEKKLTTLENRLEQRDKDLIAKDVLNNEQVSRLNETMKQAQLELDTRDKMAESTSKEASVKDLRIKELESECRQLRHNLKESKSNVETMNKQLREQCDLSDDLKSKLAYQTEQLNDCTSKLHSISEERDTMKAKLENAQAQLYNTTKENMNTGVGILETKQALEEELNSVNKEVKRLKLEKEQLTSEIKSRTKNQEMLSESLASATASVREKEQMVVELREGLTAARGGSSEIQDYETCQKLMKKNQVLSVEVDKSQKELKRLRGHLLQVEEERTHEQLQAEHQENLLRTQLRDLEERIRNQDHSSVVLKLRSEVNSVTAERDDLLNELAHLREARAQDLLALRNLQAVLEDFQQRYSNSSDADVSLAKALREVKQVKTEYEQVTQEKAQIQKAFDELLVRESNTTSLLEELDRLKQENTKLFSELTAYQAALSRSKMKIEQLSLEDDERVDKPLVRNLFVTYLSSQDKKREEVARLIGKILGMSPAQIGQVCNRTNTGWLSKMWPQPADPSSPTQQESLSSLFVSFLEAESNPRSKSTLIEKPPLMQVGVQPKSHPPIPTHLLPSHNHDRTTPTVTTVLSDLLETQK